MTDRDNRVAPLDQYVIDLFAPEDDALRWIQAEAARNQMPNISLLPHEAKILQILVKAVGARKVLEIGTLAGYSATWMARALPPDGKLITLEKSSKHASVAREGLSRAGVLGKVTLIEGTAVDMLPGLVGEAPFDVVFLDADRGSYLTYLEWAAEHLRPGGLLAAHNAYRGGRVLQTPETPEDKGMADFVETLARHPRFDSIIIGVGDAFAVGIKKLAM